MAKSYLNKALVISENINSDAYTLQVLSELMLFYDDPNVTYYKELNDKIKLENLLNQSKYASRKYEYENQQKKAKANELKFEKEKSNFEKEKSKKIVGFSIASFIALLAMFLYYILNVKHKKEKLQQVFNTESRISKQIHDEVANDVFQFMTKLEAESLTNGHLIDDLQDIYSKTRDISKEHSLLEDDEPFTDTIKDLVLSYSNAETSVIDKGSADINWEAYSKIKRTTIYKVLQELLINMKKHSEASVAVLMFKNEGKKTVISYTDNGVGGAFKKSTGLQNVENRIESINGTITFETEPIKGFKTKIVI
jgi:signal transduction histidine kinase